MNVKDSKKRKRAPTGRALSPPHQDHPDFVFAPHGENEADLDHLYDQNNNNNSLM